MAATVVVVVDVAWVVAEVAVVDGAMMRKMAAAITTTSNAVEAVAQVARAIDSVANAMAMIDAAAMDVVDVAASVAKSVNVVASAAKSVNVDPTIITDAAHATTATANR